MNVIKKSGFSQEYRNRLHKCLRELLIHIVNERNMDVKMRQLRKCYEWFLQKLIAMGSLSQQEIDAENAFLNPMSRQLGNIMRSVIKQKVHSALCNEEAVESFNKAMYEGKHVVYDKATEELVTVDDPKYA